MGEQEAGAEGEFSHSTELPSESERRGPITPTLTFPMIALTRRTTATLLTITLGLTAALPLIPVAQAQRLPDISRATIPSGTTFPTQAADPETEKILLAKNETEEMPFTLVLAANVRDRGDRILIPQGTVIEGEIEVLEDEGVRFVAKEIVVGHHRLVLEGESQLVTKTERVRRGADGDSIIQGAAIGAAAASVISVLTGSRISVGSILGGAAAGGLGGLLLGRRSVDLYTVDPNADFDITLSNSLPL